MNFKSARFSVTALFAIAGLALAGCSGGDTATDDQPSEPSATAGAGDTSTAEDTGGTEATETPEGSDQGDECWVHLFDSDDFDDTDDNFKLTEPGKYEDLSDLPGADTDWTDEADSARVGSGAAVTIWSDTGFDGESTTLEPGSEHSNLDPEPSSLEMTC